MLYKFKYFYNDINKCFYNLIFSVQNLIIFKGDERSVYFLAIVILILYYPLIHIDRIIFYTSTHPLLHHVHLLNFL